MSIRRSPEDVEHSGHILRKGGLKRQMLSGHRVHEPECPGVEGLPREHPEKRLNLGFLPRRTGTPDYLPAAVRGIAENGMMDVRQMNPDLMCPPRAQLQAARPTFHRAVRSRSSPPG